MKEESILVTGGCGFIGSHLVDRLIEDGMDVVVVDDLSTGNHENLHNKAAFHQGDIAGYNFIEGIFTQHNIKYVIHQAAKINHSLYMEDPIRDIHTTVIGTVNLIKCCLKYKVKKFIFASSVAVYGQPMKLPVFENDLLNPIYSYGIAKKCAEDYICFYSKNYGLTYDILRYSNVYGPRQPIYGEVGVIAIFTDNFIKNKQFIIYGTGDNLRDYIYIDDAVDTTILAMKHNDSNILNIGVGKGVSVNRLFNIFKSLDNYILFHNKPERVGELGSFYCDINRVKFLFNWRPKVSIEEGIKKTILFYSNGKEGSS